MLKNGEDFGQQKKAKNVGVEGGYYKKLYKLYNIAKPLKIINQIYHHATKTSEAGK